MKVAPAALTIEMGRVVLGKNYVERNDIGDLADSIASRGLLQPILVRPTKKDPEKFEVVCGTRRFQACAKLEHSHIAAVVRDMTDDEAAIAQIVENDQRIDAHPMDEAEAYAKLQKSFKIEDIAATIGRKPQYVRDRIRLNDLIPKAKEGFRLGQFELGHAIVLARLNAKNQNRAYENWLFTDEQLVLLPDEKRKGGRKARSVGELQGSIDKHVNFDAGAAVVPELFPTTAENLKAAEADSSKVIRITYSAMVDDDAKGGERVYTERSWIRADGNQKSKVCEKSVLGLVTIGPGRGESFLVCVSKSCAIHRPAAVKAAAAKAKHGPASKKAVKTQSKWEKEEAKRALDQKLDDLNRVEFKKAAPAIIAKVIDQLEKTDIKPKSPLADLIVSNVLKYGERASTHMDRGKDAKSFLRFLALQCIESSIKNHWGHREFAKLAKQLGLKVDAVMPKKITKLPDGALGVKGSKAAESEDEDDE